MGEKPFLRYVVTSTIHENDKHLHQSVRFFHTLGEAKDFIGSKTWLRIYEALVKE